MIRARLDGVMKSVPAAVKTPSPAAGLPAALAVLGAGALAVVFAVIALLQWRRASELEERVRELEAKLAEPLPPGTSSATCTL